ncbi:MAG: Maf family protein [Ruminococcus sp.]|jgi:septum formation protein|nr:Maf family protein [Ruminococcus sp.]
MLILASNSPRRKELLRLITSDFEVIPAEVDESVPEGVKTTEAAEFLAVKKCLDVAKKYPTATVIGSDTVVIKGGELLGKPTDAADAARMLKLLSDSTHSVYTGVCISDRGRTLSFTERTDVTFANIPERLLDAYIKSGSPLDKAGGYGIQDDLVRLFLTRIDGNYDSVMGLPVAALYKKLKSYTDGN